MAAMKTQRTGEPVAAFFAQIADEHVREDCRELARIMSAATGAPAQMWGKIVGFGSRKLRYANGKEVDWMVIAFAPRAKSIALYLGADPATYAGLKEKLGKHSGGGTSCLHIKRLADVHLPTLRKLVQASVTRLTRGPARSVRCRDTA
jgi:hypothetical protein